MEHELVLGPPHRHLIVNADDLGASPARDAAIFALFGQGAITSASLLVNGPSAADAAARAVAIDLPLGLHLNLSEGRPLAASQGGGGATLAGADGALRGKFGLRTALAAGEIAEADLAREIRAQFERFIALAGELPSHVDGHHHAHVESAVAEQLAPIMTREYGVYAVRLPIEAGLAAALGDRPSLAAFHVAVSAAAMRAREIFSRHGVYAPDAFLGQGLMGRQLQEGTVATALARLDGDLQALRESGRGLWVELMVHPGAAPGDRADNDFGRSPERAAEAAVLASDDWRRATADWQPASFRDLPRPRPPQGMPADRPNILVYGKLTPATGNAETARRLEAAWSGQAAVRFRPLLADPADAATLAREARRLQELAARERLDLAYGIHVYRGGVPLAAAFAMETTACAQGAETAARHTHAPKPGLPGPPRAPLPYGLLASGTDANADVQEPAKRQAMAGALEGADFLLCLSGDLEQRLAGLPLPADTSVQPNGIDVTTASAYSLRAALGLAPGRQLILVPATLRVVKGVLPLLEALGEPLARQHPEHVLVILGPPLEAGYARAVHATMADLQSRYPELRGRLIHLDGLPHADYLAALREASLVINASAHEGLCHGVMEAMAAGIPVLASDIPGNRQLIRDDENGRLFASFAALPARYIDCFAQPEATERMVAAARADIARHFSAAAEREALQAVLARSLARHQASLDLPSGQRLRLELAPGTHPLATDNLKLFHCLSFSPALAARLAATPGQLAIDAGCGSGVFGFCLLDHLARQGLRLARMVFADPHRPSLHALARTLIRHRHDLPMVDRVRLSSGGLLATVTSPRPATPAAIVCANLPQTPAPGAMRGDRYGGTDGADLLCALIASLPGALAEEGEAFLLHIGLANPQRVRAAIATAGLKATVLAEQWRTVPLADYETLQPGLAGYLLARLAAGEAEGRADGGNLHFPARLLRLSRGG